MVVVDKTNILVSQRESYLKQLMDPNTDTVDWKIGHFCVLLIYFLNSQII